MLDPDHAEARLQRFGTDADALDGARRGALAGGNLRAFEGRAGRRRGGKHAVAVADDDLGVCSDIDDKRVDLILLRRLGQNDAGGIGADMAGDAGKA